MVIVNKTAKLIKKIDEIEYQDGMTEEELEKAELLYDIKFPTELREMYKKITPISHGFSYWKDFSDEHVNGTKEFMDRIKSYFLSRYDDIYWSDEFVEMGLDKDIKKFEKYLNESPKLIPIFGHKFMASGVDNGPVFSIVGVDIIYFEVNLNKSIKKEFFRKKFTWKNTDIYYSYIKNKVPFWSDMTEV